MVRHYCARYFILIFLISNSLLIAQIDQLKFKHLSVKDGLSQSTINCICQDSRGFLWFGTQDGLNKYDGYNFEVFKHHPLDSNSISHNWIWDVFEDKNKILWIATWEGLTTYDPNSMSYVRYFPDKNNPNSISNRRPTSITQDKDGNLWIGTWGGGLNVYMQKKDKFFSFQHEPENNQSISNNFVRRIYLDNRNYLWIGTWDGLCRLNLNTITDIKKSIFTRFSSESNHPDSLRGNKVISIHEDKNGFIWLGTMYSGLFQFDYTKNRFRQYKYYPDITGGVKSNQINAIYNDSNNNLWIGTQNEGLNRLTSEAQRFDQFRSGGNEQNTLSSNQISRIYEDRSGILWVGTFTDGLNKLNLNEKQFSHFVHSKSNKNSLSGDLIRSFYKDTQGFLWIGTEGSGLNRYDPKTKVFKHFRHNPSKPYSISHDNIQAIVADELDNLWVGTYGGGLNFYDRKKDKFYNYKNNPQNENSISSNTIEALCFSQDGVLWIGTTNNGLDKYDINSKNFTHYTFDQNNPNSISTDYILSIYEDSKGKIWIGGWGGGLNVYDSNNNQFIRFIHHPKNPQSLCDNIVNTIIEHHDTLWVGTAGGLSYMSLNDSSLGIFNHFFEKDGLPNQHIYGILVDKNNLWLSTNKGLSKFTHPNLFQNYNTKDGLPRNEFTGGAYYRTKEGELYFGSSGGFISFYPDSIKKNLNVPPIVFTNFQKFNKNVSIGRHISTMSELELSYKDNVFSFEFSALDYTAPSKNQYAYKMEGFNQDWIYTDAQRRSATFTNLDPGKYTFRVKGSNNDGIWNEAGASIRIIITPPFWKTWWFRFLILIFILFLILVVHFARIRKLEKTQKEQEEFSAKLIDSQENERKRIASELHDSLGQNLLIINNELQQYIQQPTNSKDELKQISANVKESINEVREISYNLHPHQLERLGLTKAIESSINKVAHASKIKFELSVENIDDLLHKNDEIHFFRIIQETINNILKHSLANEVIIRIKKGKQFLFASISDNGKGFEIKSSKYKKTDRLGLGISDMTERTKLIGGNIFIQSEPGIGTKIELKVPF